MLHLADAGFAFTEFNTSKWYNIFSVANSSKVSTSVGLKLNSCCCRFKGS